MTTHDMLMSLWPVVPVLLVFFVGLPIIAHASDAMRVRAEARCRELVEARGGTVVSITETYRAIGMRYEYHVVWEGDRGARHAFLFCPRSLVASEKIVASAEPEFESPDRVTPLIRYVNVMLYRMVRDGTGPITLRPSVPLPDLPLEEQVEPLDYRQVCNRLKVVSGVSPVACPEPVEGTIAMRIAGKPHAVRARFADGADGCEVTLTVLPDGVPARG